MLELAYAFLADAAQFTPDGKLNMLGADFNSITAEAFPFTHTSIAIAMRFRVQAEDLEREHPVTIQLLPPEQSDTTPIVQIVGSFPPTPVPLTEEPLYLANVSHMIGVVFPRAGTYVIRITADGRIVKEFPLKLSARSTTQDTTEE